MPGSILFVLKDLYCTDSISYHSFAKEIFQLIFIFYQKKSLFIHKIKIIFYFIAFYGYHLIKLH